jgi:nicotinamide-nucleotide amidase
LVDEGVRAAVVSVGDELLLGQTVDTNASWISSRLTRLGVEVLERVTVGDVDEQIRAALARCATIADIVILGGGLGPTPDDLTRDALAGFAGARLVEDPEIVARLEERFRARGFDTLPPANRKQALVPEGGEALPNPKGTAPGLSLDVGACWLVALPGVPREVRAIFEGSVEPALRARFEGRLEPIHEVRIATTGISESVLCDQVEKALPSDRGPVQLAFYPDLRGVTVTLRTSRVRSDVAAEWLARIEEALDPVVAPFRYDSERGEIVEALARKLLTSGRTVATAESCTGGLIAKRLTDVPGSSGFFLGGLVAYENSVKIENLGVDPGTIEAHGAVSEEVARAMAEGARDVFGADMGLGVTGIAGPGGGSAEKPVGTVWYAVATKEKTHTEGRCLPGEREAVRERAAQACLALLLRAVPD